MKKQIITAVALVSTFLAGAGVGHAARDWRQLQDSKKDLYHARDHLNQAKADSFFQNLRPEHQAHLNMTIQHVNEAIGEIDRIEWHEGRGNNHM